MIFHLLGLAHQPVTKLVPSCAYTAKVLLMSRMLKKAGHRVTLYGPSTFHEAVCDEFVSCVRDSTMESCYREGFATSYNQTWDQNDPAWKEFRRNASVAIARRLDGGDHIVLASFGWAHKECCPASAAALTVEMGVGYEGVFADCKVWESQAWQHCMYQKNPAMDRSRDTVIPGYLDPDDFIYSELKPGNPLFLGRVIDSKGVRLAYQACRELGLTLDVAGPGDQKWIKENLPEANYLGMINGPGRAKLLSEAKVLLCPTQYIEPFGNVAVEAAASGTPVISSDWGGFCENVSQGRSGFRVRDIHQMVEALKRIDTIQPLHCRQWAHQSFLESVWPRYENYFQHQMNIFKS